MATEAEKVDASRNRQKVPEDWMIVFQEWTNDSLLSLSKDAIAPPRPRAYAGWELDWRIAYGVEVRDPPLPEPQSEGHIAEILRSRTQGLNYGSAP